MMVTRSIEELKRKEEWYGEKDSRTQQRERENDEKESKIRMIEEGGLPGRVF